MPRGRVQIDGSNNIVADNGNLLRGGSMFLTDPAGSTSGANVLNHLFDYSLWRSYRDNFGSNSVRLYCSAPPQNFGGGPGAPCFPHDNPPYRCYDLNYGLGYGKTALDVIDDCVDISRFMNMYLLLDYHPVGGYDESHANYWWGIIADRYKDETHVFYEATNEPVMWAASDYLAADVQYQEDIYAFIRAAAPNTHIVLWTFANATGDMKGKVDEGSTISYANASVSYHPGGGYSESSVTTLRTSYPTMTTELSTPFPGSVDDAEGLGMSWLGLNSFSTHSLGSAGAYEYGELTWSRDPGCFLYRTPFPRFMLVSTDHYG